MRILVIEASGMPGHLLTFYMREKGHQVETLSSSKKLDEATTIIPLTEKENFENYFNSNSFDIIINCAGILIEQSDKEKDQAAYINSYLPHFLEYKFAKSNTKIIHLSTDCVFSGKNAPYTEDASYDGERFYDRSKALGEIKNTKDLTLRASKIGPDLTSDGTGLFNWFYKQTGEITGYSNVYWNGITTVELAKAIEQAIRQDLTGLYNLAPKQNITKGDLLLVFKEVFGKNDITVKQIESDPSDKTLANTRSDFDFQILEYPEMIKEMKEWIESHPDLYPHYLK